MTLPDAGAGVPATGAIRPAPTPRAAAAARTAVTRTAVAATPAGPSANLYVAAARLPRREVITVGALGAIDFERGWYAYVGSARRGREARVARHCRADKPLRWHADYLFSRHAASLAWTFDLTPTERDRPAAPAQPAECSLAAALLGCESRARRGPSRFGASDCACAGHLLWFPSSQALTRAVAVVAQSLVAERAVRLR